MSLQAPPVGATELPAQVIVGDNPNGPINTQFRHELFSPPSQPTIQLPPPQPFTRFSISTKTDSLSSNFPYDARLYNLHITDEQWHLFTTSLLNTINTLFKGAKLARAAKSPIFKIFGPDVEAYGRSMHKKTLILKVKEGLAEGGEVLKILRRWNESAWRERGFHVWIEFPDEPGVSVDNGEYGADERFHVDRSRFRIAIIPNANVDGAVYPNGGVQHTNTDGMRKSAFVEDVPSQQHQSPTERKPLASPYPTQVASSNGQATSPVIELPLSTVKTPELAGDTKYPTQ